MFRAREGQGRVETTLRLAFLAREGVVGRGESGNTLPTRISSEGGCSRQGREWKHPSDSHFGRGRGQGVMGRGKVGNTLRLAFRAREGVIIVAAVHGG
jgi:hypothetical protein